MEWRIVFRASHTGRIIFRRECKEIKSYFHYYSILVTLRLKDHRDFIEVGEGSVQGLKFNQDGLCARIKKIVTNHRESQNLVFTDKVPVILNSGDGGILFHELLGHALEADYVYRKESPISSLDLGKRIVSSNVTLLTRYKEDAFFKEVVCDDDGETVQSPVLVENGVLQNFIADSFYRKKLGLSQGGFSRLEDFAKPPMPRMYGLYLMPGIYHPEELVAATPHGVYAGEFGEGKVFFNKNMFYFFIRDSHLIKNGRLTTPLGSIVVQGNILEVLNSVAMVADDFRFDKGISYCSKNNQTINVRVGQPTVKINNLTITPYKGVQDTWPQ
jgi:TldD protein